MAMLCLGRRKPMTELEPNKKEQSGRGDSRKCSTIVRSSGEYCSRVVGEVLFRDKTRTSPSFRRGPALF